MAERSQEIAADTPRKRVIRLPNGKLCGLPTYCAAWRTLKTIPEGALVKGWDHFPEKPSAILRDLRYGMHDRINKHLPYYGRGRKWSSDWQRAARHCANEVNHPRLIVRWVPHDLKSRLQHRIHTEG